MPSRALTLLLLAAAALGTACEAGEVRRSALLITLDTTNPGALGCYGRSESPTPHLDALAAESLVYDAARSVAPLTLPSHASIMTGLYPPRHTIRDNGLSALPESADTLAELARSAGFQTAAFIGAVVLSSPYGLAQGFELYDQPQDDPGRLKMHFAERPASEVTQGATRWIEARDRQRPFFLWVHYFDPHAPYQPPEPFRERHSGKPYLGEVASIDAAVGGLLAALRVTGGLDETLIVVVADHGEAHGRHGEPTHSVFCYDATLRVPLIVRHPEGQRAGQRSSELVSVVDIAPTLAEGMGLGSLGDVDGQSLYERSVEPGRGIYFESYASYLNYGSSPLAGWLDERGKYLHSSEPEFFDLERDPAEAQNRFEQAASEGRLGSYRDAIARLAELPQLEGGGAARLDEETKRAIRSLGYAGAADPAAPIPHPLAPSELPPPAARMPEIREIYEAALQAQNGQRKQAILRLERVTAESPQNAFALDLLGSSLYLEGEFERAIEILRQRLALGYERYPSLMFLGRAHESLLQSDQAEAIYRRAIALYPEESEAQERLALILERKSRPPR